MFFPPQYFHFFLPQNSNVFLRNYHYSTEFQIFPLRSPFFPQNSSFFPLEIPFFPAEPWLISSKFLLFITKLGFYMSMYIYIFVCLSTLCEWLTTLKLVLHSFLVQLYWRDEGAKLNFNHVGLKQFSFYSLTLIPCYITSHFLSGVILWHLVIQILHESAGNELCVNIKLCVLNQYMELTLSTI